MYLIDGYNLFYKTNYKNKDDFLTAIQDFCHFNNKKAVVIFDGYSPMDLSTDDVEVIFDTNADDRILEYIDREDAPSNINLVTSDRELGYEARQRKVVVIKSEEFDFNLPIEDKRDDGEKENFYLSDDDVNGLLKEFHNFKNKEE